MTYAFPLVLSDDLMSSFSVEFFGAETHFENVLPIFTELLRWQTDRKVIYYSHATKIKNKLNRIHFNKKKHKNFITKNKICTS